MMATLYQQRKAVELFPISVFADEQPMKFASQISRRGFWIAVEFVLTALPLLSLCLVVVNVLQSGLMIVE